MDNIAGVLKDAPLFGGISENEAENMLACLGARKQSFEKDAYILKIGDRPESIGLMLSGSALIVQEDFWGNRNILIKVTPPDIFSETYACSPGALMSYDVVAESRCDVLWLNVNRILTTCPTACSYHSRIIRNLLSQIASKNLRLNEKITHVGQRSTRSKILSFLSSEAQKHNNREFDIAYNRQQLADYLSVERSALSAELSRLRDEGVIDFRKNHFVLQ